MEKSLLTTIGDYKFALATCTALLLAGWASESSAQVPYSTAGNAYTQDFNTLPNTGTTATWANNSTLLGWSAFNGLTTPAAVITINVGTGSSSTGGLWDYGVAGVNAVGERALGAQGSSSFAGYIALNLSNTTGLSLSKLTINFDGEQWRNGGNTSAHTMNMEYGFGSTFTGVTAWTAGPSTFNWTSPTVSASGTTSVTLDGNATANRVANVGGTLTLASAWTSASNLWIRWIDNNDTGNDHGLAIDNFSFSAAASSAANLTWNLTTAGTWNTTSTNWTTGSGSVAYANGDNATFSNTAGGAVTLSGTLTPGTVTVSAASGTCTFTGATATDKISGTTSLAKSGAGVLALTSANDFSGGTTITAGTVQIGATAALGIGSITLNGSGASLENTSGSLLTVLNALTVGTSGGSINAGVAGTTLSGAVNHGGALTKSGAGNVTLSGLITSSAGAAFNVSAGYLTIGQTTGTVKVFGNSSLTGNLVLANGIRLDVDGGATISGAGTIQVAANGALISTTSGDTGGTISSEIALNSGSAAVTTGAWSGTSYTGNTFSTTIGATKGATTSSLNTLTVGVISGNADLDISNNSSTGGGGGKLVLNGVSTYTGNTTVNTNAPDVGGTANIVLGVHDAISTTSGLIVGTKTGLGLPVLDMNGKNQTLAYLADGANATSLKFLTIKNNGSVDSTLTLGGAVTPGKDFAGVIANGTTNNIALVKTGTNAQTLSGANTYSGGTAINGGSLQAGSVSAFGTAGITINAGGTLDLNSFAIANAIEVRGGTILGASAFVGSQTVRTGVGRFNGTVAGLITASSGGTIDGTDATFNGSVSLSDATLKGSNAIFNGPVSVGLNAIHVPGSSPGLQTFNGALSYAATSVLNWELSSNTDFSLDAGSLFDAITINSAGSLAIATGASVDLIFNSALADGTPSTVSWTDPFWNVDRSWVAIDASLAANGFSGQFVRGTVGNDSFGASLTSVRANAIFAIANSGQNVVVSYTAVPEPSTFILTCFGLTLVGWSAWRQQWLGRAAPRCGGRS